MFKKILMTALATAALALPAFAQNATETDNITVREPLPPGPVLAPVDPFAWAVANADWGSYKNSQVDSLRKIVNGQVTAHQANATYTDPNTGSLLSVKCYDPTNCVVCSRGAMESAKQLRQQVGGSISVSGETATAFSVLATYQKRQADALNEQAKWNELRNQYTVTEETTTGEGETITTTKSVKVTNAADEEAKRLAQIQQAASQLSMQQGQQHGMAIYSYGNAAAACLREPQPSILMYAGSDPLK